MHQPGIFLQGASHHIFLEFDCAEPPARLPGGDLLAEDGSQVIAFGKRLADHLAGFAPPPGMRDFKTVAGARGFHAPGSQRDLFIWLQGDVRDELFATALAWRDALAPVAELAADNQGFLFRDSRDLTGFVDGSGNPKGDARAAAALIGEGPHAGGSFVFAQRWVHNLRAFGALPVADQERVIGRTKPDSVEFTPDIMPSDAHVARTDLPGTKIYRRSTPVGGVRDAGLFFLAFSADLKRYRILLDSMFGLAGDRRTDRLLNYTTPTSGGYYYAPPATDLRAAFEG